MKSVLMCSSKLGCSCLKQCFACVNVHLEKEITSLDSSSLQYLGQCKDLAEEKTRKVYVRKGHHSLGPPNI